MEKNEFYTKVAGISHEGRQQYVKDISPNQKLALIRQPDNPYDKNAIAIFVGSNQLGFIPKEVAARMAPRMDNGVEYACYVSQVTGGHDGWNYGVNLKIRDLSFNRVDHNKPYIPKREAIHEEKEVFERSDLQGVYNYILGMGDQVLANIRTEYNHIKNNYNDSPAMGEFGSIEFAGALLIWRYCRENIKNNFQIIGELMISLGISIGWAFNFMSPGEWSDRNDEVINNNDLLDYNEWDQIYNYLKPNYKSQINKMKFCNGSISEDRMWDRYMIFIRKYNELPDFRSVFEYYRGQGLRLDKDMPFRILN